ncbi:MAG: HpcH/HpaI aldolase/citrate lyase family protein [Rhodoglobus sp.]
MITALYVPGDRPERFVKAAGSGAEMVILDLEDAVPFDRKTSARSAVASWLAESHAQRPLFQVRINEGEPLDLAVLAGLRAPFEVRVPKVESFADLDRVAEALPGRALTALFETARGVENATALASHPAVTRLALGESDLASDLGTNAPAVVDYARVRLLFAARANGLEPPMLSAYPNIRDLDGLKADTERGRDLGWMGRTAIHPTQLAAIADVFRPSEEAIAWAHEVVAATTGGGVATLTNGDMVDPAMVGRARAIINQSTA